MGVSAWGFTLGAEFLRLLIRSFPLSGIMTPDRRRVFEKRLDKADKMRLDTYEKRAKAGTLFVPTVLVAMTRHLDTGSYGGMKIVASRYHIQTGIWVDDPPKYTTKSDWGQESGAPGCVIL